MDTTLTARRLLAIVMFTLFGSAAFATAKAASPFEGIVIREMIEQFRAPCGERLCEVTLIGTETYTGFEMKMVEVEVFEIKGDVATSRGRQVVAGSFEVSGQWFSVDANARKIVASNAPALPAVARN